MQVGFRPAGILSASEYEQANGAISTMNDPRYASSVDYQAAPLQVVRSGSHTTSASLAKLPPSPRPMAGRCMQVVRLGKQNRRRRSGIIPFRTNIRPPDRYATSRT